MTASSAAGDVPGLLGRRARALGWRVGTAESLTSGSVASALGVGPGAAEWFAGAVVAYGREVKHTLLGVPEGPVVSREASVAMARGAARLLHADLVVALTGAGGPDPQDGCPPGTVWLAVVSPAGERVELRHFDGAPAAVVHAATARALELLLGATPEPACTRSP